MKKGALALLPPLLLAGVSAPVVLAGVRARHPIAPASCQGPSRVAEVIPDAAAYFFALVLEPWWRSASPSTRDELEAYMWAASQHEITPAQSCWGYTYTLKPGERMQQYLILGYAPLDVVYSTNDRVRAIFTSYE